jgi:hypothetical protein
MAGLVPAIHVLAAKKEGVDARVKPGHDGGECVATTTLGVRQDGGTVS